MPFRAPDGSNPVEYAARVFTRLKNPDESKLDEIGRYLVQEISIRTNDGESYDGSSFAPYGERYAGEKGYSEPDLRGMHDLVHMMDLVDFRIQHNPLEIVIGIFNNEEKEKLARIHDQGSHESVRGHSRGGSPVLAYLRRKRLAGVPIKGGRMIYDTRRVDLKVHKLLHLDLPKLTGKGFRYDQFSKGLGWRDKKPGDTPIVNRIGARRMPVRTMSSKERTYTVHTSREVKTPMYRVSTNVVIPSRRFLGITKVDEEYVLMELTKDNTKGDN